MPDTPTLAQPGLANHGDGAHLPVGHCCAERLAQQLQLSLAADHPRVHALDPTCTDAQRYRPHTLDEVAAQWLLDPLDADRIVFKHLEQAAHVAPAVVADAQPARRRCLLHARRDVDGVAADAPFGINAAAQQYAACVHASTHVKVGHTVLLAHLWIARWASSAAIVAASFSSVSIIAPLMRRGNASRFSDTGVSHSLVW